MRKLLTFILGFVTCLILAAAGLYVFGLHAQLNQAVGQRDQAVRMLAGNGIIAPLKDKDGNVMRFDKQGNVVRPIAADQNTSGTTR